MAKKINVKTVKPELDEKVVKKVKKEKEKKETREKQEKKERIYRVLDEIKAFLLIDLIVFVVAFCGWYWYTHFYSEELPLKNNSSNKEVVAYEAIKYSVEASHKLKVLNDKYLIDYDNQYIYKIMDLKTNILYEGEFEYTYFDLGVDGNIYVTKVEDADYANVIYLYTIKDSKLEKIKELSESKAYYSPIKYYDEEKEEFMLIGYVAFKSGYDEDMNEYNKSFIYTLNDEELELNGYQLFGDIVEEKETAEDIITFDKRYIVINDLKEKDTKYGLYDLEEGKVVITPQYDGVFTNREDEYIVVKNKKYGIVNKSLKKIVDFEYDFIEKKEDFYVVGQGNKMAIMNNQYELVTKFEFDYQQTEENDQYNLNNNWHYDSFDAYKVKDKYILVINNKEYINQIEYDKHETYVIDMNGNYTTIEENEFYIDKNNSLIYSYDKDKKVYTFYDQDLVAKYDIDISNYDYDKRALVSLLNENTIEIKLDSETYYDYTTGEVVDKITDCSFINNDVDVLFNSLKNEVSYQFKEKELGTLKVKKDNLVNLLYINLDEDSFYYSNGSEFILVYKGE